MKTKSDFFELRDISILLQYLYIDNKHTIIFNNGLTNLEVKMNENYEFKVLNHNFKNQGWKNFTDIMTIPYILGVIEILKETPSRLPNNFSNEWDEIKTISSFNVVINR